MTAALDLVSEVAFLVACGIAGAVIGAALFCLCVLLAFVFGSAVRDLFRSLFR